MLEHFRRVAFLQRTFRPAIIKPNQHAHTQMQHTRICSHSLGRFKYTHPQYLHMWWIGADTVTSRWHGPGAVSAWDRIAELFNFGIIPHAISSLVMGWCRPRDKPKVRRGRSLLFARTFWWGMRMGVCIDFVLFLLLLYNLINTLTDNIYHNLFSLGRFKHLP